MCSVVTLALEFVLLAVLTTFGVDARPFALSTVLIAVFSIAFFIDTLRSKLLSKYRAPLCLGYLWRIFLLYFDLYGKSIYNLPNSGADSSKFFRLAIQYANGFESSSEVFVKAMGLIMRWIGVSQLYSQFIVLLFSVVALVFAAKSMEYISASAKVKYRCMMALCLLPNFAILSVIFLRESVVAMFISVSLYCFVKWMRGGRERSFWLAFAFVFCASAFHSGSMGLAIGYVVVRLLYDKSRNQFRFSLKSLLPTVAFALIFTFLYINYADVLFAKTANISSISEIAGGTGEGGSTYAQYVGNSSTPLNMAIYTLPRMVFFLFSPFPWQWRGLGDIIAFCFSSVFYMFSIIKAFRYLKSRQTENRSLVIGLLIVALCLLFIFGWGTSNTGTATRHREKTVILYGILLCCSTGCRDNKGVDSER